MHVYMTCMYALHTHVTTYRHMHAQAYPTDTCIVTRITHRHMHPTATSRANTCRERTNVRTRMPQCGCMRNTHTHTHTRACIQTRMHTHAHARTHSHSLAHAATYMPAPPTCTACIPSCIRRMHAFQITHTYAVTRDVCAYACTHGCTHASLCSCECT
jgi:hypothetical protein